MSVYSCVMEELGKGSAHAGVEALKAELARLDSISDELRSEFEHHSRRAAEMQDAQRRLLERREQVAALMPKL